MAPNIPFPDLAANFNLWLFLIQNLDSDIVFKHFEAHQSEVNVASQQSYLNLNSENAVNAVLFEWNLSKCLF